MSAGSSTRVPSPGPGTLVGPYRLGRLLGRGGMASVFEATHESIGRIVALKLLSPELDDVSFAERFRREGRMQAALEHPHVVTIFEAGTSEYGPYLAMQLIRGTTLAGLIDDGALDGARMLRLLGEVAEALDAAHAAGLVHRDVKPRNILVATSDYAYLADFGLTKPGDASGLTGTGRLVGTLAYVAPEVVEGHPAAPASDRYAMAAVLFECLTGSIVFPRPTHAAMLHAHASESPPRVSALRAGIPPALDVVVVAALSKDPAERPATAVELVEQARAALAGTELGPAPRRVPEARPTPSDATVTAPASIAATPAGTPPAVRAAPAPTTMALPRRRRRPRPLILAVIGGMLAGVAATAIAASVLHDDPKPAAAPLPPAPTGSTPLGSDLSHAGRLADCRGVAVSSSSPSCTIFQDRNAGATLVVPRSGVVRRWAVRSASGELALAVLRRRQGVYFQVARSRNEFVNDTDPQDFATDLAVDRGDRLGLVAMPGSGIGTRPAAGGSTGRWIPALEGGITTPRAGPAGELLLRVDYLPGTRRNAPQQIRGAAALRVPGGDELIRRTAVYGDGRRYTVVLVLVSGRGAIDLVRSGRRLARMDVPDLRAPVADPVTLEVTAGRSVAEGLSIDLGFARRDSVRLHTHYITADGLGFQFID